MEERRAARNVVYAETTAEPSCCFVVKRRKKRNGTDRLQRHLGSRGVCHKVTSSEVAQSAVGGSVPSCRIIFQKLVTSSRSWVTASSAQPSAQLRQSHLRFAARRRPSRSSRLERFHEGLGEAVA